jgi:ABC-type transport system involved in cytochrome c biogenesis permease subunit
MLIDLLILENKLSNLCFVCLAISTLIYWIQNSLQIKYGKLGSISILMSNLVLFGSLLLRWYNSKHFPLSNLISNPS